jgi:hypothetical protein
MISIRKINWDKISELEEQDLSSELLKTINLIYETLEDDKKYVYMLELSYGDFVIYNGTINKEEITGNEKNNFFNDISYSDDPLALVIHNQIEVYTINRCDNRRRVIKEFSRRRENFVEDKEYIVPLNTIKEGDFYGVFGTLDSLSGIELPANHGMDWFAVAGISSFIFDFPFFYSTVNINEDYCKYFKQHRDNCPSYYTGREQIDFIKDLLPKYKTRVIYFPGHIFRISNSQLLEKLHYYLLIKGWAQYSPLRNIAFENKVLTDILKNISLENETEFIIKLFDYLRNVFSGNAKILRPLISDEKHFLNDAINNFKDHCKDYFNNEKKHILPLCYIYDDSKAIEVGILSLTNLPILKNYRYTNLKDVIDDLKEVNDAFINKHLTNYTLNLEKIKAFGGLDRYNPKKVVYKTKGTSDFKELIASLFCFEVSKILPTSGQFKNSIAIFLK